MAQTEQKQVVIAITDRSLAIQHEKHGPKEVYDIIDIQTIDLPGLGGKVRSMIVSAVKRDDIPEESEK
jgi:hypothetical protein